MAYKKPYSEVLAHHNKQVLNDTPDFEISAHDLQEDLKQASHKVAREAAAILNALLDQTLTHKSFIGKSFYLELDMVVDKFGLVPKIVPMPPLWCCPSPRAGQTVWYYDSAKKELEFMWSLPVYEEYLMISNNIEHYLNDPKTSKLAQFIAWVNAGELEKYVKNRNGEKSKSLLGEA